MASVAVSVNVDRVSDYRFRLSVSIGIERVDAGFIGNASPVDFVRWYGRAIEETGPDCGVTRKRFRLPAQRIDVVYLVEIEGGKTTEEQAANAILAARFQPDSERF